MVKKRSFMPVVCTAAGRQSVRSPYTTEDTIVPRTQVLVAPNPNTMVLDNT